MKLVLVSMALLALASIPTATADSFLCQPTLSGTACAYVYTDNGWAYVSVCEFDTSHGACVGGGHLDFSGFVSNTAGAGACHYGTACASVGGGQYSYAGDSYGFGGGSVGTPVGYAYAQAAAGSDNGAPDAFGCVTSSLTGATCLAP